MVSTLAFICHYVLTLTISAHHRSLCFVISLQFLCPAVCVYSVSMVPQGLGGEASLGNCPLGGGGGGRLPWEGKGQSEGRVPHFPLE